MTFKFPTAISKVFEARIIPKKAVKWYAIKFEFIVSQDEVKEFARGLLPRPATTVPTMGGGMTGSTSVSSLNTVVRSAGMGGSVMNGGMTGSVTTGSMGGITGNSMGGMMSTMGTLPNQNGANWDVSKDFNQADTEFMRLNGAKIGNGRMPFSSRF